ncbi:sigma-54 dependent transcriptional regulator [Bdellovibrionota bacterium FG-1]
MNRPILGESKPVKQMMEMIKRVAPAKTNVLIIGESGTGKELVARMIHESGPLQGKPFVPVNCGAIPENLIESEMFGHKRGSFTGAVNEKEGLFEAANGGTLFLDEVGELPLNMQVKLLRAIQERSFRKVGGNDDIKVELRIIAATNRNLESAVAAGTFREDLYYRLNVILITTPPLRERRGDVKLLSEAFLKRSAAKIGKPIVGINSDALAAMEGYAWPGNVRELENVLERAITLEPGPHISITALPESIRSAALHRAEQVPKTGEAALVPIQLPAPYFSNGPLNLDEILGRVERIYLNAAIQEAGGSKKKAATLLGITFRSIRYRLQKQGVIADPDGEPDPDSE